MGLAQAILLAANLGYEYDDMAKIDFFETVPTRYLFAGWLIIGTPLALLAAFGFMFLRREKIEVGTVVGCYIAAGAPALDVKHGSIAIEERERRSFHFTVEPSKDGYQLKVQPALALTPIEGGRYKFGQRYGSGYFWDLLSARSDNPRDVAKPDDFGGRIGLVAIGGKSIIYERVSRGGDCRSTP
jgi:hypothetical protein